MVFLIGELELDDQAMTLKQAGERVLVQPKVFDLIVYLVRHQGRVVLDEELFENVWKGVSVTRASIAHSAMKARRALGDVGRSPTMIESVRGRGLRFIANVIQLRASTVSAAVEPSPRADPLSFSSGTDAIIDLARDIDVTQFAEELTFPLLVLPQQPLGGNPWRLETASESGDGIRDIDLPARIEVFELFVAAPPGASSSLTVGRTRSCNIVVLAHSISKLHARFDLGDEIVLTDLGSHNGTRVNGVVLSPDAPHVVHVGDAIHFGQVLSWVMSARALHGLVARMPR